MFANFLENTGVHMDVREFGISLKDYYGGIFLLAWDRTPDVIYITGIRWILVQLMLILKPNGP